MIKKNIHKSLGIIDSEDLKEDEKYLFTLNYEMFPDETVKVFKKNNHLVIQFIFWRKIKKIWGTDQNELPLASLPWIVDRFKNGFLKPQSQGGSSNFERSLQQTFDDELIGINSMAHCCAENLPGFNIWNANRKTYISDIPPQQWDIPRYMLLDQGLLAQLESLANDYKKGLL